MKRFFLFLILLGFATRVHAQASIVHIYGPQCDTCTSLVFTLPNPIGANHALLIYASTRGGLNGAATISDSLTNTFAAVTSGCVAEAGPFLCIDYTYVCTSLTGADTVTIASTGFTS